MNAGVVVGFATEIKPPVKDTLVTVPVAEPVPKALHVLVALQNFESPDIVFRKNGTAWAGLHVTGSEVPDVIARLGCDTRCPKAAIMKIKPSASRIFIFPWSLRVDLR